MESNVPVLPLAETFAAISRSLGASSRMGTADHQQLVEKLNGFARRAIGSESQDSASPGSSFLETLTGSIRDLSTTSEKARLAASLTGVARTLGHPDIAKKLERRALNYAESLDQLEDRVQEIVHVVDQVAEQPGSRSEIEEALHRAADQVNALESGQKVELSIRLAKAYGRLHRTDKATSILGSLFPEPIVEAPIEEPIQEIEEAEELEEVVETPEIETSELVESAQEEMVEEIATEESATEVAEVVAEVKEIDASANQVDADADSLPETPAESAPHEAPKAPRARTEPSLPDSGKKLVPNLENDVDKPALPDGFVDPTQGLSFPTRKRRRR